MPQAKYDIFISYRRNEGKDIARMLKESLERKGYRVFLDMDELQDGVFDQRILDAIQSAPVFMILLTAHALDRCQNEQDWVRQEIEYALSSNKHIIPINPDKQFTGYSDSVPENIQNGLKQHQYSAIDTGQLYQESIDKLVAERIKPIFNKKWNRLIIGLIAAIVILLGCYMGIRWITHIYIPQRTVKEGDKHLQNENANHQDTATAIAIFHKAVEQGSVEACNRIADIASDKIILDDSWTDIDTALYYYHKAAEQGNAYAEYRLGDIYSSFFDGHKDDQLAFYWTNRAYQHGQIDAIYNLAVCYEFGMGVDPDIQKAYELYKESANHENVMALLKVSAFLKQGSIEREDYVEGMRHLVKAYQLDTFMAKFALAEYRYWIFDPQIHQQSEDAKKDLSLRAISYDTTSTLKLYFRYTNHQFFNGWMQIDSSAYIQNTYTKEKYLIGDLDNCTFSPQQTSVDMGDYNDFVVYFYNIPDTLTKINFLESDTSQWKMYEIDLTTKSFVR
ncbi:MAG: toll/interleukin-1 receptor domain-containing protein [Paludibacteraceae bacterium]|nr:toll/interleukin-1 receptor domain-containing protein [Paludibacteraceae bacterium]